MVDVVYASDDLTVYSGPTSLNVNVGIGSQGQRGSRIYSLTGDPRELTLDQFPGDIQEYDFGILINGSSGTAIQTFQKIGIGINDWVELEPISVNIFSAKQVVSFNEYGIANLPVPVSSVFSLDVPEYTTDLFSIQYQIEDTRGIPDQTNYPTSSTVSLSIVPDVENNIQYLVGTIVAIEYNPILTAWVPVTGLRTIHGIITVV